jgi:hypothetical protein
MKFVGGKTEGGFEIPLGAASYNACILHLPCYAIEAWFWHKTKFVDLLQSNVVHFYTADRHKPGFICISSGCKMHALYDAEPKDISNPPSVLPPTNFISDSHG